MLSKRSFLAGTGAVAAGITFGQGAQAAAGKLRFYNWDTYIGDHTLSGFKAATGVDVRMELFATNDELFARIAGGSEPYDVIVPSNDIVTRMVERDLLMALDHGRLPNLANIGKQFRDPPYDPGCAHSVPFSWIMLGLGYRKSKMRDGKPPVSWKAVFDSDSYRIAWLSEPSDMIRLGAKYLGHAVNELTPAEIAEVERLLTRQAPRVAAFHNDDGQDMLLGDEVDIVVEYNGDIASVMAEDADIGFVVPNEGSLRFVDCWAIPKRATNPDAAYAFLNYMMDAQAGADISRTIRYPTPNDAARRLMPEEYRNNPAIFPPSAAMDASDFVVWPGADTQRRFDEAFARVRLAAGR